MAFRSLSRLSSALSAKASALRSFLLDLSYNKRSVVCWVRSNLSIRKLDSHLSIFCIATDDNHNKKHQDSFGVFVLVNCDALEYGQVMNSLKAGDFYASTGPEIYEITLEGDTVSVQCSKAKFISLSTCGRRAERKSAPQGEYIGEAQFKLADDDVYFRIDVVDECGNRANSRAYFI